MIDCFLFSAGKSVSNDVDIILEQAREMVKDKIELEPEDLDMMLEPVVLVQEELKTPSFVGRVALQRTARGYLVNLLAMVRQERIQPNILKEKIDAPLFIVGLNRSGTTFLQNMLAADPRLRTTRFCEMVNPYGMNGDVILQNIRQENHNWHEDPRLQAARDILEVQMGTDDSWLGIHYQSAEGPEEEFPIFEHVGRSYSLLSPVDAPEFREWLCANNCEEMKNGYKWHKRFLQHLQSQVRGEKWILKMPFHLFALDAVFEEYPDAKVIFMHREPAQTIPSWSSLVCTARRTMATECDQLKVGAEELDGMSLMMEQALKFRSENEQLTKDRFLDLKYTDLLANPINIAKQVYDHIGIEWKDYATAYIEKNKKDRKNLTIHKYTLEDFGLDKKMVNDKFSDYTTKFSDYLS